MKSIRFGIHFLVMSLFFFSFNVAFCKKPVNSGTFVTPVTYNFENIKTGALPAGWKVETTGKVSKNATWKVVKDQSAPSGNHVLALQNTNHSSPSAFNLCWTDKIKFSNGTLTVKFKARTGKEDQGGGIMWRIKDKNNYYVARFNPLEDNFRIYYVRKGIRRMLSSARVKLSAGKWHTLKIVQKGKHYKGYINGKLYLKGTVSVFNKAGGVGLWTKADAVTSFDDFSVR